MTPVAAYPPYSSEVTTTTNNNNTITTTNIAHAHANNHAVPNHNTGANAQFVSSPEDSGEHQEVGPLLHR